VYLQIFSDNYIIVFILTYEALFKWFAGKQVMTPQKHYYPINDTEINCHFKFVQN